MDETVGDVPSEGGDSSRRFGIYRAYTPEPRVFSVSRLSLLFVACIAGVVAFAVFFPMFASRYSRPVLPFPEIANKSAEKDVSNINCSSNVLSFGNDCTETSQTYTEVSITHTTQNNDSTIYTETTQFETSTTTTFDDPEVVAETRHLKVLRTGRSEWPSVSTPYPYYLPKPTQGITDRVETDVEEAIIISIPSGPSQENATNQLKNKNQVNFTPPPYAFTPFPNFTDSYAQLLPYKVPANYTNLDDILRYLKSDEREPNSPVPSSTETSSSTNRRLATMKVSGTYRMPLDRRRPGDNPASGSEKIEEARPFFNGHAYISDPFVKFRPSNPIDVNRLVPLRPDVGSRFRRPLAKPSAPPAEMAAEDSQDRNLRAAAGSYTEAIFHGAGSVPEPSDLLTPPPQGKPLSVTLDIYPVTVEMPVSEPPKGTSIPPWRDRGRFRHLQRPRWRPQAARRPTAQTQPPPPPNPADNHMVVHLNLFPNRRKSYAFPRRSGVENLSSSTPKATILGGGHFGARSLTDPLKIERDAIEMRVTTAPFSTSTRSTSSSTDEFAQYSALTGGPQDEAKEDVTTMVDGNIYKKEEVTTEVAHSEDSGANLFLKDDLKISNSTNNESGLIIEEKGNVFLETNEKLVKSNIISTSIQSFDKTSGKNSVQKIDTGSSGNNKYTSDKLLNGSDNLAFELQDVRIINNNEELVSTEPFNNIT